MRQWKSLVALHAAAPSCFPHPPSPSPPRDEEVDDDEEYYYESDHAKTSPRPLPPAQQQQQGVVRLVGCDGRVQTFRPPVTARELTRQHPRHLVCRADALLIGERIPAVAPGEELQPGQAYFLLPAHLFRSVLSFVSLASSLLLLLSSTTSPAAAGGGGGGGGAGKKKQQSRPFELCRTAAGTLQIKFSDDFLVGGADVGDEETDGMARQAAAVLRGDQRLEKEYEELVGYGKSRRWAPKLEPIQEVVVVAAASTAQEASSPPPPAAAPPSSSERRKSRGLPFLGRLGSRRRRESSSSSAISCNGGGAVACSG